MPSVRKSYDEELLQLDTLLARMGHEAGAAIESALTALRNDDIELARSVVARDSPRSTQANTRSNTAACSCCCASSRWLRICARSVQP